MRIPIAFRVNRESRQEALRQHNVCFSTVWFPGTIYANLQTDGFALSFNPTHVPAFFYSLKPQEIDKITGISVPFYWLTETSDEFVNRLKDTVEAMQDLQTFVVDYAEEEWFEETLSGRQNFSYTLVEDNSPERPYECYCGMPTEISINDEFLGLSPDAKTDAGRSRHVTDWNLPYICTTITWGSRNVLHVTKGADTKMFDPLEYSAGGELAALRSHS